jgi:hypothetical protein
MRSKLLACTALALAGLLGGSTPVAHAADPKGKGKKKQAELGDAITKQLQWEDKVMGPDDKRAELDKIARAQAITKAAAEKAERDKAEKERQAAREAAQPRQQSHKSDVSLPSVADDSSGRSEKAKAQKMETAEAPPPPPPAAKPADDRFIDKLLKDESASNSKKKASKGDDRELEALLANTKDKPAAKGHGKKGDMVDNLLESAEKAPAMPTPKSKPVVPEWAKPELSSAPAPAPIAIRAAPKKDDGVIHVVQGAAGPAMSTPRPAPVAARVTTPNPSATRRQAAAKSGGWSDPFADSGSKKMATRDRDDRDPFASAAPPLATTRRMAPPPPPPVARREPPARPAAAAAPSADWNDPFADAPARKPVRRTPPPPAVVAPKPAPRNSEPAPRAHWKDPFSDASPAAAPSARAAVAMREPVRGESAKWEIASSHHAARAATPSSDARSRWGAIKKRAR